MLSALILTAVLGTHSLEPTDDVWIYQHAGDQVTGQLLVWGNGVDDVSDPDVAGSYSILRFDLGKIDEDMGDLQKATLVLMHVIDPVYTKEESKATPLQARVVSPDFTEQKWNYLQFTRHFPDDGKKAIVGQAGATPTVDGKPFKIEIVLDLKNAEFKKALEEDAVAFALTTKMATESTEGPMYKVFSRSAEKDLRPKLVLVFKD